MKSIVLGIVILSFLCASCGINHSNTIVIGSKNFTEQEILGELMAQQIESHTHVKVVRRFYLNGTYICHQAILAGRIDMYVEYTGTALMAILKDPIERDAAQVFHRVQDEYAQRFALDVLPSLGFNNTFAIIVRGDDSRKFKLKTISDLSRVAPQWRAGFGYEFMERPDGYDGLARTYGLRFAKPPLIMDLGLLYRSLFDNEVEVIAGSSTDGQLSARDLTVLEDDKHYFPPYQAVPIVRPDTFRRFPEVRTAIEQLAGKISDVQMRKMNYEVDGEHEDTAVVVHNFLQSINSQPSSPSTE